jgi:hypothetical protein
MAVHLHAVPQPADALHLVAEDLEAVCRESDGALRQGTIVSAILDGSALLWLVLEEDSYAGCYVTEVVEEGGFCHIVACRMRPGSRAFEESLRLLSEWAHGFGARLSASSVRPGMGKLLGRLGWQRRFVEYVEPPEKIPHAGAAEVAA